MPTLYDNFNRVKDFINENNSSYVSKAELASASYATTSDLNAYLPLTGGEITGPLNISFITTNNGDYGFNSYSHIIAGNQDKTGVTLIGTKRKCGGENGTSYMSSFFTNSDGRSKFAHKTKISDADVGVQNDDAFMCFNAYGFKIAYSGAAGTAASTEYELVHSGNIGNFGYASITYLYNNGLIFYPDTIDFDKIAFFEQDAYFEVATTYMSDLYINGNQINTVFPTYAYVSDNFITQNTLDNASYTTTTDLNNYLPITGGNLKGNLIPSQSASYNLGSSSSRWKEVRSKFTYTDTAYLQNTSYTSSIIPKETATYTLGDETHLYSATYSARLKVGNNSQIYNDSGGITFSINSNNGIRIGSSAIYPKTSGAFNNGTSSNKWNATYTSNLYADNIHNFIWTGTSAQYAALSDYTTYQIYLIQEA